MSSSKFFVLFYNHFASLYALAARMKISAGAGRGNRFRTAHARPSARPPIDTRGNFSQEPIQHFGTIQQFLNLPPLSPMGILLPGLSTRDPLLSPPSTLAEIFRHPWGQGGSPNFFFYWNPPIFVTQESMQNFKFLRNTLIGVQQRRQQEKKTRRKEKKNMQNSGLRLSHTVCTAPLGPIT